MGLNYESVYDCINSRDTFGKKKNVLLGFKNTGKYLPKQKDDQRMLKQHDVMPALNKVYH